MGPDHRPPIVPAAATFKLTEADLVFVRPTELPNQWWHLFSDPVLDRLVGRALARNTDLRVAAANLQRSRAVLSEARSARLPVSSLSSQYTRQRFGGQVFGSLLNDGSGPTTTNFFDIGSDASYEVDLFGGVDRSVLAARASAQAAQALLDASRVSVAADTAAAYVQICSLAAEVRVARETTELQQRTLELTERLLRVGRGTEQDVEQARVLLEQARAQIPSLEAERRAALAALTVLTGLPPAQAEADAQRCSAPPNVRQPMPVGGGRALIARRPDVRAAERVLAADTARIGVATAALYPSVSLLGAVNLGATSVGDLGNGQSFGFALGPLIQWNFPFNGAARARVRQAEASARASLAAFDGAVLQALRETEQALARLAGAAQTEEALERASRSSDRASQLAADRYRAGADSFLQLLEAERQRALTRAALSKSRTNRAQAQIALFRALGGGWQDAPDLLPVDAQ